MTFSVQRDDASAPFFEAADGHTLLIRRCPVCGRHYPPYHRRCGDSDTLEWVPSSGRGRLVAWAVDHAPALDPVLAGADGATSAFGLVELDEGPWLQVALVDVDPAGLEEGTPMRVRFVRPGGGEAVPAFTRAADPD